MATIQSILNRISEMGFRIGKNSIGKGDLFGLLTDIVKRQQSTELNMTNLSLRKIYASVVAMEADVAAPMGDDGKEILKGQLVVISAVGVDMGKVYRYSGAAWEYIGMIGDLSQKASKADFDVLDNSVLGMIEDLSQKASKADFDVLDNSVLGIIGDLSQKASKADLDTLENSAPRFFEIIANLPANVEVTIPGTDFEPILNLRPSGVQVFYDGELKTVGMKYLKNGNNYDVKLTSAYSLPLADVFIQAVLLNIFYITDSEEFYIIDSEGFILIIKDK